MFKKALLFSAMFWAVSAQAEVMTIGQVKKLLNSGKTGEAAAIAYVQGITDGMLGMEALHHKEKGLPFEFCKFQEAHKLGKPILHPAYQTRKIVEAWEREKQPMSTIMVDVMLMYLTAQYGC